MTQTELEAERDELAERCKQDLYEAPAGMVDYSDLAMVFKAGWDSAMEHMPKWTPVSEGLPEDGEPVLYCVKGDTQGLSVACKAGEEWRCAFTGTLLHVRVSAWMPIPEAYKP